MPSESRTVSISSSEFIDVDRLSRVHSVRCARAGLLWQRRLGRGRILQVVFSNESLGDIHALGRIQNRHLAAIDAQRDTVSFGVSIEGLTDIVLQGKEQILISLLILCFGVFTLARILPFLLSLLALLALDLPLGSASRLL